MRKFVYLALLLTGCVSTPQYGNFVQKPVATNDKKIADDVVNKLIMLYPPASTRFDFQHATPDFFGMYLIESMRSKGYAVLEFNSAPKIALATAPSSNSSPSFAGATLAYILDQGQDSNLYRVTLVINHQQSLGRVYQLQNNTIYPAGYWIRKE